MQYTIKNSVLSCKVDSFGGELVSVVKAGKERLWQNETGEWAGHAPLLFPVCGHCGVTVNGVSYPIGAHGFAKKTEFSLVSKTETSLTLEIESTAETKKVYPFDFRFEVTYAIEGNELSVSYRVQNPAQTPLYFACGGHESFALDSGVEDYELRFEKEETFLHLFHNDDGYMTGETFDYGTGKVFALPQDFMQEGRTLIFKDVQSRKVALYKKGGEKCAELSFEGYGNLLLWRADNAKYICIEAWTNLPDPENTEDIEFSEKEGVIAVAAGEEITLTRKISY